MSEWWVLLVILFAPLVGGSLSFLFKIRSMVSVAVGISFLLSLIIILITEEPITKSWYWTPTIEVGIYIDKVALLLISLVTFISLLVCLFSTKYMEEDKGIFRYFIKLGIFIFSMIGLLFADDLILLLIFWELVGVSSFLLIGFWYQKEEVPTAAKTTFMVNRVCDISLFAGILLLYSETGELSFSSMTATASFLPSLLISIGTFGKSAQFPFSGWLTKAMVGPTPVSALIHAATMVAAGVYLLFRFSLYIDPDVLLIIAYIGIITTVYGAIVALNQYNIKKLLAYSTISQLGYMMMGIGVGASEASLFHLMTHAFFKAGLFLGATSIIHYLSKLSVEDPQDIRFMGGLKNKLPWTYRSFLICGLALAGIPFFSGFLSKDAILVATINWADKLGSWAFIVPSLAMLTLVLTACYVGKVIFLTFLGKPRTTYKPLFINEHSLFLVPLILLAFFSFWIFFNWNPVGHSNWILNYWGVAVGSTPSFTLNLIGILSVIFASVGLLFSYIIYKKKTISTISLTTATKTQNFRQKIVFNGFYLTHIYLLIGQIVYKIAVIMNLIEIKIVNYFVYLVTIILVVFSKILAATDRFFIDRLVNSMASLTAYIGRRLAGFSSRDLQTQFVWLIASIVLILVFIIFF